MRKELERVRRKALGGTLTDKEFRAIQHHAHEEKNPLRGALTTLRRARKRVSAVEGFPPELLADLDAVIARFEKRVSSTVAFAKARRMRVSREKV